MGALFGTDGIRGKANRYPITPEVALQVGKAVGKTFRERRGPTSRVLIGKDTRLSGYMLETALTSGLVSMGADVLLVGPVPTPAVAHLTRSMGTSAGIMLTASHNPHEDNGIKIFGGDGYKLSDELEEQIEQLVLDGGSLEGSGSEAGIGKAFRLEDARGRYIEFAKSMIGSRDLAGLRIVLDCANGAAYSVGPLIFRELGAEVIEIGVSPNGTNINDECGALHIERVSDLVRTYRADVGIALDGDADRVIFCDSSGAKVDGDRILGMCALDLKRERRLAQDTLVVTSMSNLGLVDAMKRAGIAVEVTDVGDRQVIECMRRRKLNLGGEKSGHVIFGDYATTGDGVLSALQVLSLMKRSDSDLAGLCGFMEEYPQQLESFAVRAKPPLEELGKLSALTAQAEKEMAADGRVVIRYSGTENKMRILVECRDGRRTERWCRQLVQAAAEEIGV